MPSGPVETFRTHANYLNAFAMLCSAPYQTGITRPFLRLDGQLAQLTPAVVALPSMKPPTTAKPDFTQTHASLINAWGTEMLLSLGGQLATGEELRRLMNNWAVVQAYYVGYHATQALLSARGQPRPESHPKTQTLFADMWADRSLHLPPWTLAAIDGGWRNAPPNGIDDSLSPWSSCDAASCWNLAAKALRTTRDDAVRDRISDARDRKRSTARKAWQEHENRRISAGRPPRTEPSARRPRLTPDEKRKIQEDVRSFTLLDYLYRLRIKTNYEDAAMFIDGPEDDFASAIVHRHLVTIASCTLLVHELHIAAAVGKGRLLTWADTWLAANAPGQALGLALRRDLIDNHAP